MTDKQLVAVILNNPEEGLKIVIKEYGKLVYSIVAKIIGKQNEFDIEECVSSVFVRLWRYGNNFDSDKGTLQQYIMIIARNEALKKAKSLNKKLFFISCKDNYHKSIETILIERNCIKSINTIISELEYPDKEIMIQRYFFGEKIKDIAKNLDVKEKFIANRIYRVKKQIKKELIKKGDVV